MINFKATDVNLQFAIRAHNGISMSPERRGQQYVGYYVDHMTAVDEEFSAYATDENREAMAADLEKYRAKWLGLMNAVLNAKSNCASSFITGGSGFNVARANKANDRERAHTQKWLDYPEWKLAKLRRLYNPRALFNAPIRLDDAEAVKKLEKKIGRLKTNQEAMKAANKIVRSKKLTDEQKIDEIVNTLHFTEEAAERVVTVPDFGKRFGFPSYALTNNNANIKRLEGRLREIMREQSRAQPDSYDTPEGVEVVENTEATRIQIVFNGKPEYNVRQVLKRNGFRWAPSQNAWQRLLNRNGRYAAKQALAQIKEM
jgi:hypothetical protein